MITRNVAAMCGLAGIIPLRYVTSEQWEGMVSFNTPLSQAIVTYPDRERTAEPTYPNLEDRYTSTTRRLIRILSRIEQATNSLEQFSLLDNSFIILVRAEDCIHSVNIPSSIIRSLRETLELCWVSSKYAHKLHQQASAVLQLFYHDDLQPVNSEQTAANDKPEPVPEKVAQEPASSGAARESTSPHGRVGDPIISTGDTDPPEVQPDPLPEVTVASALDACALSVQAIAIGLLSFTAAHTGRLHPFFLESGLEEVTLRGIEGPVSRDTNLKLSLVQLSCMGDMLGSPVLVFSCGKNKPKSKIESFDLVSSAYDILELWGPGEMIFKGSTNKIRAINVAGGSIKKLLGAPRFHWDKETTYESGSFRFEPRKEEKKAYEFRFVHQAKPKEDEETIYKSGTIQSGSGKDLRTTYESSSIWSELKEDERAIYECGVHRFDPEEHEKTIYETGVALFEPKEKIKIGGLATINTSCFIARSVPENSSVPNLQTRSQLHQLDTFPEHWEQYERQGGIQAGQYFTVLYNTTWIRSRAQTIKSAALMGTYDKMDLRLLESPWGLAISLCTGVARRVPLREVIAEAILPMVRSWAYRPAESDELFRIGIVEKLRSHEFGRWFNTLEREQSRGAIQIIDYVLRKLSYTGFSNNEVIVACPSLQDPFACTHMATDAAWASILKDSEDSATYACTTAQCFQTDRQRCSRARDPTWHNTVTVVATAVCHYEWDPKEGRMKIEQPRLKPGKSYLVGNSSEQLRAVVSTEFPTSLRISRSSIPYKIWARIPENRRRLVRLQEQRLWNESHAEDVLVLTNTV